MAEAKKVAGKPGAVKSLVIPCATVFVSSFCIMVLELVAGRILARYLGSSLYTWTSVIGVVLAGITVGNYLGGRLADGFSPRKTLAVLFAISSAACVVTIVLNNFAGEWTWLWQFSWPMRTFLHVSLVFMLPSTILGTISPVAAKMGLERGLPTGRTVGDIYAWSAAGSIAGTFAAGYYLIAVMGTIAIIWMVGGVMILMALFYGAGLWISRLCGVLFLCALTMGIMPWQWTQKAGGELWLRKPPKPDVIYEDETQYCHIAVETRGGVPEERVFIQDKLIHSSILMGDISTLRYSYEQIMAAVTHRFGKGKDKYSFMIMGGGGYVLPRYLEKFWPGSIIDVVEIDPKVTEAAHNAFGLDRNTAIKTIPMDARNYVDELIEQQRYGKETKKYDFIYEDALDHYSMPYQLATHEFNEKLAQLLTGDGVYLVELIDIFDSGLFLGAYVNTLRQTFPFVAAISEHGTATSDRNTFVIVAARHKLDLENVCAGYEIDKKAWYLSDLEMADLGEKSGQMTLTDDYAPVENLLAPVVRQAKKDAIIHAAQQNKENLAKQAEKLAKSGDLGRTLAKLDKLDVMDASMAVKTYSTTALIFAEKGLTEEALEVYRTAVKRYSQSPFKNEMTAIHYNFGMLLNQAGSSASAKEQFRLTAEGCRNMLAKDPNSVRAYMLLGNISAENGDFQAAVKYFQNAVSLKPGDVDNNITLIQAFEAQGSFNAAIDASKKAIEYMLNNGQQQDAEKIQKYSQFIEFKKSQSKDKK